MDHQLKETIEELYRTFAPYESGSEFCGHCYDQKEIAYMLKTPVRELNDETARQLMWESSAHWQSDRVYRHYLPKILQAMAPPTSCEDIFTGHVMDTIGAMGYDDWPQVEKALIRRFFDLVTPLTTFSDAEDKKEWTERRQKLDKCHYNGCICDMQRKSMFGDWS